MEVYDNTLREGVQNIDINLDLSQKIKIISLLIEAGIKNIEVGFIAVNDSEKRQIKSILDYFKDCDANLFVFGRLLRRDINDCIDVGAKNITLFVPCSESLMRAKLHKGELEVLQMITEEISYARQNGLNIRFSCEDATNASTTRLIKFYKEAKRAGAFRMSFPDTMGTADYYKIASMIAEIKHEVHCSLSIHCHNDMGLATANALAAIRAGVDEVQGTILGVGERVGNTDLLEVLLNIYHHNYSELNVDFRKLRELYTFFSNITGYIIPPNKPIIGKNQFVHESGLHVQSMVDGGINYESVSPEIIGESHQVFFGKMSGIANINYLCKKYRIQMPESNKRKLVSNLKAMSEKEKRSLSEKEVMNYIFGI